MGQDKSQLPYKGVPLYRYMTALLRPLVDTVYLSAQTATHNTDSITVHDLVPHCGPISGIHACVQQLNDVDRLLIVPVDMPLLSSEVLNDLLNYTTSVAYEASQLPVVLQVTNDLRRALDHAVQSDNPKDYALWRLFESVGVDRLPLAPRFHDQLTNANTPEEWLAFSETLSQPVEKYFMAHHHVEEFVPVNIAVLTVSDTRTLDNDSSGQLLVDMLSEAGHNLVDRAIVKDDIYKIREVVSRWIATDAETPNAVQAVLVTGGTGFSGRDSTPEALLPIFDKEIKGYGELFRQISYEQIKTSTIQSRTVAGMANNTVIFVMPGSNNACKTAWQGIIHDQLDSRHRPCNFVEHLKKAN